MSGGDCKYVISLPSKQQGFFLFFFVQSILYHGELMKKWASDCSVPKSCFPDSSASVSSLPALSVFSFFQ